MTKHSKKDSFIGVLYFLSFPLSFSICCGFLSDNPRLHHLPSTKNNKWESSTGSSDKSSSSIFLRREERPNDGDFYDGNGGDMMERNHARTDVRYLLTQASIQSFMFLCSECRDPHTGRWIESFLDCPNLSSFHGTGAFDYEKFPSWDSPLSQMIEKPKDVVIVSAKRRGRGHGGWSKNNPYMQDRYVEYKIDIDPASISSRILSVREQIAKEWIDHDFDILREANNQILDSYFQNVKANRDNANNIIDLFDRTAINVLANHTAFQGGAASSPFRKGNFDLLYNLCTQESVHRLIRNLREIPSSEANEASYVWLCNFYSLHVSDYFDGDQKYGRADDFIEKILFTSPSIITEKSSSGKTATTRIADPVGIAEQLIQTRTEVVDEWQQMMRFHLSTDHAELRKKLLDKQMLSWGSSPSSPTTTAATTAAAGVEGKLGSFE